MATGTEADEARDLTPWLAKPENLRVLAEAIAAGLPIEFSADNKNGASGIRLT